jgi:hypothetical protein
LVLEHPASAAVEATRTERAAKAKDGSTSFMARRVSRLLT